MTILKKRIGLPPTPTEMRPVERHFVVPRPSPSIHEGIFDNPANDPSLHDIKRTIGGLRTAVEAIQRGAAAIHQNEMKTIAARHSEALDFGFKVLKPALQTTDSTAARLNSEIAALKAKVSTPPPIRDILASEIRTALRNMKASERTATVLASAKAGDDSFMSAVLSAPAMLSGLSATQHEHLRKSYGAVRFPAEVERIEQLEKAMVHMDRASSLAIGYSAAVADRAIVDKAKESAARAAEAIAEANRPLLN